MTNFLIQSFDTAKQEVYEYKADKILLVIPTLPYDIQLYLYQFLLENRPKVPVCRFILEAAALAGPQLTINHNSTPIDGRTYFLGHLHSYNGLPSFINSYKRKWHHYGDLVKETKIGPEPPRETVPNVYLLYPLITEIPRSMRFSSKIRRTLYPSMMGRFLYREEHQVVKCKSRIAQDVIIPLKYYMLAAINWLQGIKPVIGPPPVVKWGPWQYHNYYNSKYSGHLQTLKHKRRDKRRG